MTLCERLITSTSECERLRTDVLDFCRVERKDIHVYVYVYVYEYVLFKKKQQCKCYA